MAPPREIPGFYYDEARGKYFRIEDSKKTVLPDGAAAWRSEGEVKRRRKEVEREQGEREWKERVLRERVRRVDVGWRLNREIGRGNEEGEGEGIVREWAGGLQDKGKIKMWRNLGEGDRGMIDCLHVVAQEKNGKNWEGFPGLWSEDEKWEGLAWVYAGMREAGVSVSAAPLDEDRRVNYEIERVPTSRYRGRYVEFDQMLSRMEIVGLKIKKRSSTEEILSITHGLPEQETQGATCWVGRSPSEQGMQLFGGHAMQTYHLPHNNINAGDWAPDGSMASFVVGTKYGVYQHLPDTCSLSEIDTRPRSPQWRKGSTDDQPPFRGDMLAIDFLQGCPQVVLAGTRSRHICQLDLRTPPEQWESKVFRHKSSVAHIRSVGPYNILAAGPRNAMCIYDIRFTKAREQKASRKHCRPWEQYAVTPAVEFPGYRNEAYIKIGLDVLKEPGYGHGVVAAAQDDCTVGLYSVRDGSRIPSADVDKIKAPGVIKAMMFQTLAYDHHPSLFVGVGPVVQKFSF